MYGGELIMRLDDTNPAKENSEFVESLLKDVKSLGINSDKITFTSDYFPQLMEKAEELIRKGKAYVDDTPVEQMRTERDKGVESKCRNKTVQQNLELWQEMILGSERGVMCCLRGKLDSEDLNKCIKDPVYYRCNLVPHHRVGSQYKIYPTYDFASPFVDAMCHGPTQSSADRAAQPCLLATRSKPRVSLLPFGRLAKGTEGGMANPNLS